MADLGSVAAKSLPTLSKAAVELVHGRTGVTAAEIDLQLQPKLPIELGQAVVEARAAMEALAAQTAVTSAASRRVAGLLRDAGLAGVDIAAVLGVSEQRVSQLLSPAGSRRRAG